jgi:hypothetical protein
MVNTIETMAILMAQNPMTSIPVHADVLRRLQSYKTGGKTWDKFLAELLEDYDPPEWLAEIERRRGRGKFVPQEEIERLHLEQAHRGR